jgi:hypothetical protein
MNSRKAEREYMSALLTDTKQKRLALYHAFFSTRGETLKDETFITDKLAMTVAFVKSIHFVKLFFVFCTTATTINLKHFGVKECKKRMVTFVYNFKT